MTLTAATLHVELLAVSTAEEVSNALDVTAPTLHAHLRKAEASLLTHLVDQPRARN